MHLGGWQKQQLVKLACSAILTTPYYLITDADLFYLSPVGAADMLLEEPCTEVRGARWPGEQAGSECRTVCTTRDRPRPVRFGGARRRALLLPRSTQPARVAQLCTGCAPTPACSTPPPRGSGHTIQGCTARDSPARTCASPRIAAAAACARSWRTACAAQSALPCSWDCHAARAPVGADGLSAQTFARPFLRGVQGPGALAPILRQANPWGMLGRERTVLWIQRQRAQSIAGPCQVPWDTARPLSALSWRAGVGSVRRVGRARVPGEERPGHVQAA
jgi:Family of unknown function (DUF6492)